MTPFTSLNESDYPNIYIYKASSLTLTTDYTTLIDFSREGVFYSAYLYATNDYIKITLDNIEHEYYAPSSLVGGIVQANDLYFDTYLKTKSGGVNVSSTYIAMIYAGVKFKHLKIESQLHEIRDLLDDIL